MKVFVQVSLWAEVEGADQAADLAIEAERASRLNFTSVLEQRGASEDDLTGLFGFLGVSYWLIDEEKVTS